MVAISLYKGNLHRAPDTPRQWLMPTRKISLKDFKTLLQRRSRALARLQSTHATTSNPNPNPNSGTEQPQSDGSLEVIVNDSSGFKVDGEKLVNQLANSNDDDDDDDENGRKVSTGDDDDDDDCLVIPSGELLALEVANSKVVLPENGSNASVDGLQQEEKLLTRSEDQLVAPKDDTLSEKEKRKKEVEEKLQVLNERKHKLVQVLKQILHAEEELRRRNNVQGITITGRPIVSLQVDVTNTNTNTIDSGSMRENGGDVEGVDVDDVSTRSRNMTRMSPSSDSLHRRPPFSMVPNSSRGFVGSSPSRFAPTSPSPSPAGGTSVFRDPNPNPNPNPNPWN